MASDSEQLTLIQAVNMWCQEHARVTWSALVYDGIILQHIMYANSFFLFTR